MLIILMDMMLEEELIDLMTFCLQNPDFTEINENILGLLKLVVRYMQMAVMMQ